MVPQAGKLRLHLFVLYHCFMLLYGNTCSCIQFLCSGSFERQVVGKMNLTTVMSSLRMISSTTLPGIRYATIFKVFIYMFCCYIVLRVCDCQWRHSTFLFLVSLLHYLASQKWNFLFMSDKGILGQSSCIMSFSCSSITIFHKQEVESPCLSQGKADRD